MNIINYKLIDYLNQEPKVHEEYSVALRYLKPRETSRQIMRLRFKEVNFIRDAMNSEGGEDLIKVISLIQEIKEEAVLDLEIIEFFGLMASVREQLKIIQTAEERALTPSRIDQKWEQVNGSERMAKFGIYNTLESLSGGDATKYDFYMNMEYSEIFTILLMRKTQNDLQFEMSQIKTTKS